MLLTYILMSLIFVILAFIILELKSIRSNQSMILAKIFELSMLCQALEQTSIAKLCEALEETSIANLKPEETNTRNK